MTLIMKKFRVFVERCTFKVDYEYGSYNHSTGMYSGAIGNVNYFSFPPLVKKQ